MLYRTMPKNNDSLSILGFGCMRYPMLDGKVDEARAIRQIRSAIDRGVNYVDTAWPYHGGESEVVLGKALRDGYRDRAKLATKLPSWMITNRADMDCYLDAQLRKLETDHIDYYLIHALDGALWDTVAGFGVAEFLDQALKDGRIVNAGFSFHGLADDFVRIVDAYPWTFCQIQFNYLDREYQAGLRGLRYAAEKGLGVIVMEPLRGGNLTVNPAAPAVQAIWDEAATKRTPAEWALRWIWNFPEVTVILSGMNEESQIDENLALAATAQPNTLAAEELALVDRAAATYKDLMKVGCTGCGYCMPCPSGVAIPICFEEYNKMHMFGPKDEVIFRYAFRMSGLLGDGSTSYASQCTQCGACLDNCPQLIPIPDVLATVAAEMEGSNLPELVEMARKLFKIEAPKTGV